jgi:hypothetical protein
MDVADLKLEPMYLSEAASDQKADRDRRRFARFDVQCRARIRIGTRQYAGYIHNISQGGARLRTISPIRKVGAVILRLPDLPPLRCRLCWTDAYHAGVLFELALPQNELRRWTKSRRGYQPSGADIAELTELAE